MAKRKAKDLAKEKLKRIEGYIRVYETLATQAPNLYRAREWAKWECTTLSDFPSHAESPRIESAAAAGLSREIKVLDELDWTLEQSYSPSFRALPWSVGRVDVLSTSGSAGTALYTELGTYAHHSDPSVSAFAAARIIEFEDLHNAQDSVSRLCHLLEEVKPERRAEFEQAMDAATLADQGTGSHNTACLGMRNLLQHLKGDLWNTVRQPPEQKPSWEKIIRRLAIGRTKALVDELVAVGSRLEGKDSLSDDLSVLLKTEQSPGVKCIKALSIRLQSDLMTILDNIDLSSLAGAPPPGEYRTSTD